MAEADRMLGMYLHLARASHVRRQPMVRDRLLLLAGVLAEQMGLEPISALCRHKILAHNARHLVRSWPTLNAALGDVQFQSYLKQLHRRYSQEKIEHMLDSLGIELGREREAYFDDLEYAAALLDTRPDSIDGILARNRQQPAREETAEVAPSPTVSARTGPAQTVSIAPAPAARTGHEAQPGRWSRPRVRNVLIVGGGVLLAALLAAMAALVRAMRV